MAKLGTSKKQYTPRDPHRYTLTPGGFPLPQLNYRIIMESLSSDPTIAERQKARGVFKPEYTSSNPDKPRYDALGRIIQPGELAIVTNKMDKIPLKVIHVGRYVVLEDPLGRGGRYRCFPETIMIIQDQLMANVRRKRMSENLEASLVTGKSDKPLLKIKI
ncbi:hypothetical protein ABEL47_01610 [Escherichia coli]